MTRVRQALSSGDLEVGSDSGAPGEAGRSVDCTAVVEKAQADAGYFAGRMLESVARAGASADSLARLAHYELSGRYSIAALAAGRLRSLDHRRQ